jgi:hypothetical protein
MINIHNISLSWQQYDNVLLSLCEIKIQPSWLLSPIAKHKNYLNIIYIYIYICVCVCVCVSLPQARRRAPPPPPRPRFIPSGEWVRPLFTLWSIGGVRWYMEPAYNNFSTKPRLLNKMALSFLIAHNSQQLFYSPQLTTTFFRSHISTKQALYK